MVLVSQSFLSRPISPAIKRTEAIVEENGKSIRIVKGAPQVIDQLSGTVPAFAVISKQLEALPADTSVLLPNNYDGFGIDTPATASITFLPL